MSLRRAALLLLCITSYNFHQGAPRIRIRIFIYYWILLSQGRSVLSYRFDYYIEQRRQYFAIVITARMAHCGVELCEARQGERVSKQHMFLILLRYT